MRGLLAIECLYHQIVAGNKTQTRRSGELQVINDTSLQMNGHQRGPDDWIYLEGADGIGYNDDYPKGFITSVMFAQKAGVGKFIAGTEVTCKPRYKVGEVLYLKEPYYHKRQGTGQYQYAFNPQHYDNVTSAGIKFKNKLFMPESAARAFVKITGIRCERLLNISDEDCIAEGIESWTVNNVPFFRGYVDPGTSTAKHAFINLYRFANKISPKKDISNPWVFVYEFQYLPNYSPNK